MFFFVTGLESCVRSSVPSGFFQYLHQNFVYTVTCFDDAMIIQIFRYIVNTMLRNRHALGKITHVSDFSKLVLPFGHFLKKNGTVRGNTGTAREQQLSGIFHK